TFCAASFTGEGLTFMRWPGRSGWVTTSATSCPAPCRAISEGTANSAVPMKTSFRKALPRGCGRGGGHFLLVAVEILDSLEGVEVRQPVDEQDAVEVVDLVLESARCESARLDADFLAAPIAALDHDRLVPRDLTHPAGVAEAALVADLHAIALH